MLSAWADEVNFIVPRKQQIFEIFLRLLSNDNLLGNRTEEQFSFFKNFFIFWKTLENLPEKIQVFVFHLKFSISKSIVISFFVSDTSHYSKCHYISFS